MLLACMCLCAFFLFFLQHGWYVSFMLRMIRIESHLLLFIIYAIMLALCEDYPVHYPADYLVDYLTDYPAKIHQIIWT